MNIALESSSCQKKHKDYATNNKFLLDVVRCVNPTYKVVLNYNPSSHYNASVWREESASCEIVCLIKSEHHYELSSQQQSASIDGLEAMQLVVLAIKHKCPAFVLNYFEKDGITYLFKLHEDYKINSSVTKETRICQDTKLEKKVFILPFDKSYRYCYSNERT